MDAPNLDWLISVDDHILEPPHLSVDRVAVKDRERAPRMETINAVEYWIYDGKRFPTVGLSAAAGKAGSASSAFSTATTGSSRSGAAPPPAATSRWC